MIFPKDEYNFPVDYWNMRRFRFSIKFLEKFIPKNSVILDLGTENSLSDMMKQNGWEVYNTSGQDLDFYYEDIQFDFWSVDCVTAFEILEHLVNPFEVLRHLPGRKLIASVPLRLWFAKSFNKNEYCRHFHEFEKWQFDWLLEKTDWKIMSRNTLNGPTSGIGIRPLLRWFYPNWYFIYAERYENN